MDEPSGSFCDRCLGTAVGSYCPDTFVDVGVDCCGLPARKWAIAIYRDSTPGRVVAKIGRSQQVLQQPARRCPQSQTTQEWIVVKPDWQSESG